MRSPFRRYGVWLLTGVALALLIAAVAVGIFTRTDYGRGRVLGFTLEALGGSLNGVLAVDRLDGNVLTGARLYEISLTDRQDVALLEADSAFIEYDLPTFLGGDVVINQLVVYGAEVLLVREPGDSLWNYQEILQDTAQRTGGGAARATLIEALRLVQGDVTVILPWEPDDRLAPAAQRRAVRAALADTSRLVVDSVPGGLIRTIRFELAAARASELYISPDERGGTTLRIDSAAGDAFLYSEPALSFRQVAGELALREGVLRFDAPTLVLPDSRLAAAGVVDVTGEEPAYDVALTADSVTLADLQWLYPALPAEGAAAGRLWVETRPEGLMLLTRELRLRAPGTLLQGGFGVVLGDTLRFLDTELTADPLDVETVEGLLPGGLPVRGLRIGAVEIGGNS